MQDAPMQSFAERTAHLPLVQWRGLSTYSEQAGWSILSFLQDDGTVFRFRVSRKTLADLHQVTTPTLQNRLLTCVQSPSSSGSSQLAGSMRYAGKSE
jgi:hypothetical protein